MSNLNKEILVIFEKIGHNGVSIGKYNNKVVFTYGVLPSEEAKVKVLKEKKNFISGEPIEIIKKSPYRIQEQEDHYISCSPWQVFDYQYQIELKKNLFKDICLDFLKKEINLDGFYEASKIFGYRTKIEYSFLEDNDQFFIAFHKRDNFREKIKVNEGCALIDQKSNDLAKEILKIINHKRITSPKSLIIRKSKTFDDVHISILATNRQNIDFSDIDQSLNFVFAYSNEKSPVSNFDEILYSQGKEFLREKIFDLIFQYHYTSFFQNNIELFEKVLGKMKENLDKVNKIVDLYCGVGVIGISLKNFTRKIIGVESNKISVDYSKINAKINTADNFESINLLSEKIPSEILDRVDVLILDPPRSGLHPKLISKILQQSPLRIFYLSCNPLTQVRDLHLLLEKYEINKFYAFDFYPNTPHFETLAILDKKN